MENVVSIIAVFAMPVLVVAIAKYAQLKETQSRNSIIAKAIEAGKEINPELLVEKKKEANPHRLLLWSVVLICLSIAGFVPLYLLVNINVATLSLLLLLPGIGLLVAQCVLNRQAKK